MTRNLYKILHSFYFQGKMEYRIGIKGFSQKNKEIPKLLLVVLDRKYDLTVIGIGKIKDMIMLVVKIEGQSEKFNDFINEHLEDSYILEEIEE